MQDSQQTVPEGYQRLALESPFISLIGPVYEKRVEGGVRLALRAEEKHCNLQGKIHGGVISTLADMAIGFNIGASRGPIPSVTANLNVDYLGAVNCGDWLEVTTEVHKAGRRLAFASCLFNVGPRIVAKASAVYSTVSKPSSGADDQVLP